jgi:hypothetical protein
MHDPLLQCEMKVQFSCLQQCCSQHGDIPVIIFQNAYKFVR